MGADSAGAGELPHSPQHQVIAGGELGLPAGFDDDGLVRLDDDRRAFDFVAWR